MEKITEILSQLTLEDEAHFFTTCGSLLLSKIMPCLAVTVLILQILLLIKKNKLLNNKIKDRIKKQKRIKTERRK